MKKQLLIIVGKSGAGKDYTINKTQKQLNKEGINLSKIISLTSRKMRPNETDGVDYHFVNKNDILKMEQAGLLWEKIEYANAVYAYSINDLEKVIQQKNTIPFIIATPNGWTQIVKANILQDYQFKTVFFDIEPTLQISRIKNRDPNINEQEITKRLMTNIEFDTFLKNNSNQIDLYFQSNNTNFNANENFYQSLVYFIKKEMIISQNQAKCHLQKKYN